MVTLCKKRTFTIPPCNDEKKIGESEKKNWNYLHENPIGQNLIGTPILVTIYVTFLILYTFTAYNGKEECYILL